jgi:hypothetical protein
MEPRVARDVPPSSELSNRMIERKGRKRAFVKDAHFQCLMEQLFAKNTELETGNFMKKGVFVVSRREFALTVMVLWKDLQVQDYVQNVFKDLRIAKKESTKQGS